MTLAKTTRGEQGCTLHLPSGASSAWCFCARNSPPHHRFHEYSFLYIRLDSHVCGLKIYTHTQRERERRERGVHQQKGPMLLRRRSPSVVGVPVSLWVTHAQCAKMKTSALVASQDEDAHTQRTADYRARLAHSRVAPLSPVCCACLFFFCWHARM